MYYTVFIRILSISSPSSYVVMMMRTRAARQRSDSGFSGPRTELRWAQSGRSVRIRPRSSVAKVQSPAGSPTRISPFSFHRPPSFRLTRYRPDAVINAARPGNAAPPCARTVPTSTARLHACVRPKSVVRSPAVCPLRGTPSVLSATCYAFAVVRYVSAPRQIRQPPSTDHRFVRPAVPRQQTPDTTDTSRHDDDGRRYPYEGWVGLPPQRVDRC